jgi:hypothetical protein
MLCFPLMRGISCNSAFPASGVNEKSLLHEFICAGRYLIYWSLKRRRDLSVRERRANVAEVMKHRSLTSGEVRIHEYLGIQLQCRNPDATSSEMVQVNVSLQPNNLDA